MEKEKIKMREGRTTLGSYTRPGHLGSNLEIREERVE